MKKTIIIIVAILVIAIGGYLIFTNNDASDLKKLEKNLSGEQMGILNWLTSGKGVECSISSPEGAVIVKAKNGKVRIEGMAFAMPNSESQADKGVYINDGEWIYMWNGSEGTKMNIESMKKISGEEEDDYSWQDWANDWQEDKVGYDCKDKNLDDSLFQAPSNVNFKNLTEMMENLDEMNKKLEESIDAGEILDMEEIMEQFEAMNQEDIENKLEEMGVDSLETNLQIEE